MKKTLRSNVLLFKEPGELTEWPKVLVLKTNVSAMAPRVRIPYSPPPMTPVADGSGVFRCNDGLSAT